MKVSRMTKCQLCKTYAKTLPGRLCGDCYWEDDKKFRYNLYFEARKQNGQGIRNDGENKHPPPQGEDRGLGVLSSERTNATLTTERNGGLPGEKPGH